LMKGNKAAGRTRTFSVEVIIAIAVIAVLSLTLTGCGGSSKGAFEGVVKASGSTTVLPIAQEAAVELGDMKKGATVQVQGGGSSVGIQQLKQGIVQIANSSRELKPGENPGTFVDHKIAFDIIAIVINPANPVKNLTVEQAKGIFTGKIRNWKEVGGQDKNIIVVVRDQASGTREIFDQKVLGSTTDKPVESVGSAIECASNGVMRETIGITKNGIGYISFGYINKLIRPISYNGVAPTVKNAIDGKYPIARYLHMFTNKPATGTIKEYIDFVLSNKFQDEIVSQEYIQIRLVQSGVR
jgi:phosphate transport system substrate-binding protein